MPGADLHLHTTCSDGTLGPAEIVRRAAAAGLEVIAITDHDTVDGLAEAFATARELPGLQVIPGVELSTDIPRSEVHILGYFMDYENPQWLATMSRFQDSRVGRAQAMVARLAELGMPLSWERVRALAGGSSIGRPHIAQALRDAGYTSSVQEAFEKYIGRNGPAYADRDKMTPVEAIQLIREFEGCAVLAHPGDLGEFADLEGLLSDLKAAGLAGIEAYYGSYPDKKVARFLGLARKYALIPCGGTDYHGLGSAYEGTLGQRPVPLQSVERLRTAAGRR